MYNRILVPLDGSELAECSLEHVKEVALGCHIPEVLLVSVIEPTQNVTPPTWGGVAGRQTQKEARENADTTGASNVYAGISTWKNEEREKRLQEVANDYLSQVADRLTKE